MADLPNLANRERAVENVDYVARVNRALDYIQRHLGEPLNLDDVAKAASFSPFHFHRIFRALVGETLNVFIKRVRLERALYLRAHHAGKSLTEIALACGFASSSDFSRSFRRQYGAPPRTFDFETFRREQRKELKLERLPAGKNPDGFAHGRDAARRPHAVGEDVRCKARDGDSGRPSSFLPRTGNAGEELQSGARPCEVRFVGGISLLASTASLLFLAAPTAATEPAATTLTATTAAAEVNDRAYYYVGMRYRPMVVPKFMLNLFIDEGATIFSNTIGAEFERRKNGFSVIPALSFTELGKDPVLVHEKDASPSVGNYSLMTSDLKALYATVDLLWSTRLSDKLELEYGGGVGLGVVFGDLGISWVSVDPNGAYTASDGRRFAPCQAEGAVGSGCSRADHQNATELKLSDHKESSWANGGKKPNVFPWLALPQVGLRFRPVPQFAGRLGIGFSLTGFWLGLSGAYGLPSEAPPPARAGQPQP